jgi:DNA-binding response OmpR family regulator
MTTILLVDDEDLLREGVREILEMSDYSVVEARDGEEALALFAVNNVDLVISEIVRMGTSGKDSRRRVVSARFGLDSALLSGANASLTKPFNAKQLLEKVQQLLNA